MFKKIFLILLLSFAFFYMQAQVKTTSLSAFKDGKSFIEKSGKVNPTNGKYRFEKDLPQALYGTLWFDGDNLAFVNAYQDSIKDVKKPYTDSYLPNIIVNAEKKCKLHLHEDETEYEGYFAPLKIDLKKEFTQLKNDLILTFITTDEQWLQFKEDKIQDIIFLEKPNLEYPVIETKIRDILEIGFNDPADTQKINMFYVSNGFSWYPFYLIRLLDENNAEIIMNAELVNWIENLDDIRLNLIIGQPNLSQANTLTPLINFNKPILKINQSQQVQTLSNARMVNMTASESLADDFQNSYENSINSTSNEDFHIFSIDNFSLDKGGRSQHKIFDSPIAIDHYYKITLNQNGSNHYYYERSTTDQEKERFISTHFIRTKNTSKNPWTSAPVFIVNEENGQSTPLCQDKINYTSVNNSATIKITETPDIFTEHKEEIVQRDDKNYQYNKVYYDKIKVKSTITVYNYKKTDRPIEINRNLTGTPVSSEESWETNTLFPNGPNDVNQIKWTIKPKGREKISFTYFYNLYIN